MFEEGVVDLIIRSGHRRKLLNMMPSLAVFLTFHMVSTYERAYCVLPLQSYSLLSLPPIPPLRLGPPLQYLSFI